MALAFLREDLTANGREPGVRRAQAGSVVVEYDGSAPVKRLPDAVLASLKPFLDEGLTDGAGHSLPMAL